MSKSSMRITDNVSHTALPPLQGGGAPDIAGQLRRQQEEHTRVLRKRAIEFWWYRIVLVVLAVVVAAILGEVSTVLPSPTYSLAFFGAALGILIVVWVVRRPQFGFVLFALVCTAFFGKLFEIKALYIYPMMPMILVLFFGLLVQTAFHVRKPILPSFWAIWPHIGLIVLALVSTIMIQLTWTHGVPHKINSNPIYYDEILGVLTFFLPLITFLVTTTILTENERLLQIVQNCYIIAGLVAAVVVGIDFKRIGGDIYSFRFSEPHIGWISLRALSQILALAAMLAYVRFLYAPGWRGPLRMPQITLLRGTIRIRERVFLSKVNLSYGRMRVIYGILTVLCSAGVIVTLQNSWWVELAVALAVITVAYSWRLVAFFFVLCLPLLPVVKSVVTKVQAVKGQVDSVRLLIAQDAFHVWLKQPVLGVGPGDFWEYDQIFTNLPRALRNFNGTGLGVAHDGYLQVLGELGPLGLFFWIAFPIVVFLIAFWLYRRVNSTMPRVRHKGNLLNMIDLGLFADADPKKRQDAMLALVCMGLIVGSAVGDAFSGGFFVPPRQISVLNDVPQLVSSWIIWAAVMYKDKLWRLARKAARVDGRNLTTGEYYKQVSEGANKYT